ncbi:hypothetical protein E3_0610 [Rhodococcus phage E3]|uniref:hypothetical protein n=1 Tax=Rhodococcus phage E3 TaxID=1007869 RepID=UPI0002C6D2D4|nr:hypothetical protein M176_gp065 [Rhodococcus phage E3]AEQ20975.1 hypothetical protein E3_0610 [Rhodococcus phage E3]
MSDWKYPDDVDHSIELSGVYDGVCIWVLKDGRLINQFAGEGSRRERAVDSYIETAKAIAESAGGTK